jgi:hypothetical protein
MKTVLTSTLVCLVAVTSCSCSDSDPRIMDGGVRVGSLGGTISVVSCIGVDSGAIVTPSGPVAALCGESSDVGVSFELAGPSVTYQRDVQNRTYRFRELVTGMSTWTFENPAFEAHLKNRVDDMQLTVVAFDVAQGFARRVRVSGEKTVGSETIEVGFEGDFGFGVDDEGFPILPKTVSFSGEVDITVTEDSGLRNSGQGSAEITLENLEAD